jgi:hypothetical protein
MKQPDPWTEIGPAGTGGSVNARRVDPQHPHNFFWARDAGGRPMLVLQHASASTSDLKPPVLQGIEVDAREHVSDGDSALLITLKRQEDREIFHRLCADIVEAARRCTSERDAVREAIARTWKWHALLKRQSDGRLSSEAQQGLVGELLFLERLLDRAVPASALEFWRGPLDEPRDFVGNGNAVEVKARQAGLGHVLISSEAQLADGSGELALVCVEISPAAELMEGSFTLDQLVNRVRARTQSLDPSSLAVLNALLAAAGWLEEHVYDDRCWVVGTIDAFAVREGFPRITPAQLQPGVSNVRYRLDLLACAPFQRPFEDALSMISGDHA